MTIRTGVVGASGYAGGELLRLLVGHPVFRVAVVAAGSSAGRAVGDVHPHLPTLTHRIFDELDPAALSDLDLLFIALPHGQSAGLIDQLPNELAIIDLGADFRLTDPNAWQDYYGSGHAGSWTYGLPELSGQRAVIADSSRVANPGCYPTSVALGAAPILAAGLAEPSDVVVVAASGTSGAGRGLTTSLLGSEVMSSMAAYKVGGTHQHTPEMEQTLSHAADEPVRVSFTPLLAPMPRGILATITCPVAAATTTDVVRDALHSAYASEPFVHLLGEGRWPRTSDVMGSNSAHLQATVDEHAGRVVIVSAIDNLVKGAAGQAVQNANLVFGLDEGAGLVAEGVAP